MSPGLSGGLAGVKGVGVLMVAASVASRRQHAAVVYDTAAGERRSGCAPCGLVQVAAGWRSTQGSTNSDSVGVPSGCEERHLWYGSGSLGL
jgi:hypothetical protein